MHSRVGLGAKGLITIAIGSCSCIDYFALVKTRFASHTTSSTSLCLRRHWLWLLLHHPIPRVMGLITSSSVRLQRHPTTNCLRVCIYAIKLWDAIVSSSSGCNVAWCWVAPSSVLPHHWRNSHCSSYLELQLCCLWVLALPLSSSSSQFMHWRLLFLHWSSLGISSSSSTSSITTMSLGCHCRRSRLVVHPILYD